MKDDLVARVKKIQREDIRGKEAWWKYCDSVKTGSRDPQRHTDDFMRNFLDAWERGVEPRPPKGAGDRGFDGRTLKLRGLPYTCKAADIVDFLREYDVLDSDVTFLSKDGRPSGECFATFPSRGAAERALQERNKEKIGTRYIEIFKATEREVRNMGSSANSKPVHGGVDETPTLKLRGLPFSSKAEDVSEFLADYGVGPPDVAMLMNAEGRPSGDAFVTFRDREDAERAESEMQRRELGGRYIELFPALHEDWLAAKDPPRRPSGADAYGRGRSRSPPPRGGNGRGRSPPPRDGFRSPAPGGGPGNGGGGGGYPSSAAYGAPTPSGRPCFGGSPGDFGGAGGRPTFGPGGFGPPPGSGGCGGCGPPPGSGGCGGYGGGGCGAYGGCGGGAGGWGAPSGGPGAASNGGHGNEEFENLVASVKRIQKAGEDEKQKWWNFCDSRDKTTYDPARHNPGFLREFLDEYHAGVIPADRPAGKTRDRREQKEQRREQQDRHQQDRHQQHREREVPQERWQPRDLPEERWQPRDLPEDDGRVLRLRGMPFSATLEEVVEFLKEFEVDQEQIALNFGPDKRPNGEAFAIFPNAELASRALEELQRAEMGSRYIELFTATYSEWHQACDRSGEAAARQQEQRREFQVPPSTASTGDAEKDELIARIKDIQRFGEEAKSKWWTWCDTGGDQGYDPRRYDNLFLADFITAFEEGSL